jgi:protein tyrosine/serine phosphatase
MEEDMLRLMQYSLGILCVIVVLVLPGAWAVRQQAQTRNLHVVRPGILYRSGQMSREGLLRTLTEYRIRTLINLRDGINSLDRAEEDLCHNESVRFVRILPSQWGDSGGSVPVEAGVRCFREIMSDPRNYPVLVHCFAGIHRTGAYCAIYRMEQEHWSNAQALTEMRTCGYSTLDEELDILGYLEQYRPAWLPKADSSPVESPAPDFKKANARKKASRCKSQPRMTASRSSSVRNE